MTCRFLIVLSLWIHFLKWTNALLALHFYGKIKSRKGTEFAKEKINAYKNPQEK